jgi:glycosyltransferase involved in cell wall biosynthesis
LPRSRPDACHVTVLHPLRDPRIFYKEVPSLRAAGFDVRLLAPHHSSGTDGGVPIVALPPRLGRPGRHRAAVSALRELRPRIVHLHDPELLPIGRWAQRTWGALVVYDRHEAYGTRGGLDGLALRGLERWAVRWLDHVVLAEEGYRMWAEASGVPHTVVPNYALAGGLVTPKTLPASPTSENPIRLLYTGNVTERRGLQTMLDLAALIKQERKPWHLTLCGRTQSEAERRRAEARIASEGLDAVVERVGWDRFLPQEEMAPFLERAHVGLCLLEPSENYAASVPTKLYEYLQHALPTVATDLPRWRRFLESTDSGALVPPGDARTAFDAVDRWIREPDAYAAASQSAADAAPQFRWERAEEQLAGLYASLLD